MHVIWRQYSVKAFERKRKASGRKGMGSWSQGKVFKKIKEIGKMKKDREKRKHREKRKET